MSVAEQLRDDFKRSYGVWPKLYRAPGRVNLIGEHTDYNDGFVMPAALDLYTWVAAAPRADRRILVRSSDFQESRGLDLDAPRPKAAGLWSDYVWGVVGALEKTPMTLGGADLLIKGEVPIGAGLSSSAAIEVATALALIGTSGRSLDRVQVAKLCQSAENDFVGMRCGIMDQFISCCAEAGKALLLDCRSLECRQLPLPARARLVLCNTLVKHELAASQYNTRRKECETGVSILSRSFPGIRALRDATLEQLEARRPDLPDPVFQRCRHVISENARVQDGAKALDRGDLAGFGRLMAESHDSLRDDYQVSCSELDTLVGLARRSEGVYGARMTGGGFGGCTVNLVAADAVEGFKREVSRGYKDAFGRSPEIFVCAAAEGASLVNGTHE